MSQSREELINQRDELIEQLQGHWEIEADIRKANRLALRTGGVIVLGGLIFTSVLLLFILPFSDKEIEISIWPLFLVLTPFFVLIAFVVGLFIHLYAAWFRRLKPIVVEGSQLVWNKRKGFVPERIQLHNLTEVYRYQGQYHDGGVFLLWIMKYVDKSTMDAVNPCMFVSKGDHNLPKIFPSMIKDGERFISLLEQVAIVNTELNKHAQDSQD